MLQTTRKKNTKGYASHSVYHQVLLPERILIKLQKEWLSLPASITAQRGTSVLGTSPPPVGVQTTPEPGHPILSPPVSLQLHPVQPDYSMLMLRKEYPSSAPPTLLLFLSLVRHTSHASALE